MRTLYHHPLSTQSRLVRLAMNEKHLDADQIEEPFWLRRGELLSLNPAGDVPVLIDPAELVALGDVLDVFDAARAAGFVNIQFTTRR